MSTNLKTIPTFATPQRLSLTEQLQQVSSGCSQCQSCVSKCQFLRNYGDPKKIAAGYDPSNDTFLGLPFECSLCGLCTAVCQDGVNPVAMFLEMRRESVDRGQGNYPAHKGLKSYEKKGTSQRFSWYALPENCDTIFFPGCSLTGSRPEQTLKAFEVMQKNIPNAGMVLDCCANPSHDLGKEEYFHAMFGEMKQFLIDNGINTVLVACPNCHKIFSDYAPEFATRTIYEIFDASDIPETAQVSGKVNVHDPCVSRFSGSVQDAVRSLAIKKGLTVVEAKHSRQSTLCCGEGGAVGGISPELAQRWTKQRSKETDGSRTVTYCAGCANYLGVHGPTNHILDLLFDPQTALADKSKVSKAPFSYLNRLKVKKQLQKTFPASITRERTFTTGEEIKGGRLKKLALLAAIIGVIVAIQVTGASRYL